MQYIVQQFTPKKFASRFDKTTSGPIAATGGFTVVISDTTDLDAEGDLIIDTAINKWEVVHYTSKDDGASTITVPSWGRAVRGNLTSHDTTASIKAVPSAETLEYFDRNLPLIQQGQIIFKEVLDIMILPLNGKLGTTTITYAGGDVTVANTATTYLWLDTAGALQTSTSAYATTPIIKLGRVVAAGGVVTIVYDDRELWMGNNVVDAIGLSNSYSIPNVKAIIDYMTAISSGVISVNTVAGAITLAEGTGVTITESPAGTFTFAVDLSSTMLVANKEAYKAEFALYNQIFN